MSANNGRCGNLRASRVDWGRLRRTAFNLALLAGGIVGGVYYLNGGLGGFVLRADGFIARDHVTVAPAFDGRVLEVFVKPGDRVRKGQKVALVQSASISRTLAEIAAERARLISRIAGLEARKNLVAETLPAAVASAKQTAQFLDELTRPNVRGFVNSRTIQEMTAASVSAVERAASLKAERGTTDEEIAADEGALAEANAAYANLSAIYGGGILYAPADGDIGGSIAAVGQVLVGGAVVAEIYVGVEFVIAYLPDSYLFDVVEGQPVRVKAQKTDLTARIERIMPVAAALPIEFQNPNKIRDRGRLVRVSLSEAGSLPVNQKVQVAGCFQDDCRTGLLYSVRQAGSAALETLRDRAAAFSEAVADHAANAEPVRPTRWAGSLELNPKRSSFGSSPCDAPADYSNVGDEHPRDGAGDGGFKILGEAATAAKPSEGALDDPSERTSKPSARSERLMISPTSKRLGPSAQSAVCRASP